MLEIDTNVKLEGRDCWWFDKDLGRKIWGTIVGGTQWPRHYPYIYSEFIIKLRDGTTVSKVANEVAIPLDKQRRPYTIDEIKVEVIKGLQAGQTWRYRRKEHGNDKL